MQGRGMTRPTAASGSVKREDVLRDAAMAHLLAGSGERACELLAEVSVRRLR